MKYDEWEATQKIAEDFYAKCSEILNIPHEWHMPYKKRNRWNARRKGNGSFPGYGVIRFYNPSYIQVMSKKCGSKIFTNVEDVYTFLKK